MRLSRWVVFLRQHLWIKELYCWSINETLQQMKPDTDDIQSYSTLTEYKKWPKYMEKCCLVDFVLPLRIVYPTHGTPHNPYDDNIDDLVDPEHMDIQDTNCNGTVQWYSYEEQKNPSNNKMCKYQSQKANNILEEAIDDVSPNEEHLMVYLSPKVELDREI